MERLSRLFVSIMGTPWFLLAQTVVIGGWILTGGLGMDVAPFILLNLILSTQAAYATPLILSGSKQDAVKAQEDQARMLEMNARITEFEEREAAALEGILARLPHLSVDCGHSKDDS